MSLITLIVVLVVVGVIMWLITSYIPMEPGVRKLLVIAVIIFLVLWILSAFGLLSNLSDIRIGS